MCIRDRDNVDVLNIDGRMVMLGALGGIAAEYINVGQIIWKRLSILGSTLRSRSQEYKRKLTNEFTKKIYPDFESGNLSPIIFETFDWTDVNKAHELMERNENAGKLILKIVK